jgi:uncharacterized protein (TIGR02118 family)
MVKFVAVYSQPPDRDAFDRRYAEHLPVALAMPDVQGIRVSKATGAPRGEPPVYQVAEVLYRDRETMMASLSSPAGIRAYKDVMAFAKDLVRMYFAEERVEGAR